MSEQLFYIPPLGPTKFMSSVEQKQQRKQSAKEVGEDLDLWLEVNKKLRKKKKARDESLGSLTIKDMEILEKYQGLDWGDDGA